MMMFRQVKAAIQQLLESKIVDGKYRVLGSQKNNRNSISFVGDNRAVEVYFKQLDSPKDINPQTGPTNNNITIQVEFTVAAETEVDLNVLNDPEATDVEYATALAGMKDGSDNCDESMDELLDFIYQLLMDPRNRNLGLDKKKISSRWVDRMLKDDPNPRGQLVVLTGSLSYNCRVCDEITGAIPVPSLDVDVEIKTSDGVNDDDETKTGIKINS